MALSKSIKQDNGIPLSYHRILFVHSAINTHISIAVISYVDEESRENGKRWETSIYGYSYI